MKLITASLLLLLASAAHAQTAAGLHIGSWHSKPGYENANPGAYVRFGGAVLGAYRNSHGRGSAYAGWSFETPEAGRLQGALTIGAVTGYSACTVCPLAVPSVRIRITDSWAARIAWLPVINREKQGANAVHIMLEKKL